MPVRTPAVHIEPVLPPRAGTARVEPTIVCANCQSEIRLTESLAAPLVEQVKAEYRKALQQKDHDIAQRESVLQSREEELQRGREAIDAQVAARVKAMGEKIAQDEARKARAAAEIDLAERDRRLGELTELLKVRDEKLAEAQAMQAEALRQRRELEDARRELDLTVERRVGEMLSAEREKARRDAEEALRLKVAEKDQLIQALQCKVEDLGRRIEQGSQQSQGEVQELLIESLLRDRFPSDVIEPVGKGEHGGDVVQRILCPNGQPAGAILWESKRTRNYQANWLPKLRADQRAARAEVAVLVSQALPAGLDRFDLVDGVYVVEWRCLLPIATTLRQALLDIAAARQAGEGQATKIELVYQYLTGPRFRQRVQAIVEKFTELQADLDRERKFLLKQWSKRQEQIHGAVEATAGMYGDLQGIAGRTLLEIDGLATDDAPLLPDNTADA